MNSMSFLMSAKTFAAFEEFAVSAT